MNSLIFFIFFSSIFILTEASAPSCSTLKCNHEAPSIRFPFPLKSENYELFCRENTTMIHFPSYGDLIVKSISHKMRKLDLMDPKNCVHEVFLNLNLSLTPFRYYYVVKNYTYLYCSTKLVPSFVEIPCLSGSGHHVYTAESSLDVPDFCRAVKTIVIPFAYSPYLSSSSFGLGLTWDLRKRDDSEAKESQWSQRGALSLSVFALVVLALVSVKIDLLKGREREKENLLDVDKLLGDSKAQTPG